MSKNVVTSVEFSANSKTNELIFGLIYVLVGLITAVCGQGMLNIVVALNGALFLVFGLITYYETRSMGSSIFSIVLGLVFLVLGLIGLAADIIRILFGLFILLMGLFSILGSSPTFMGYTIPDAKNKIVNTVIGVVLIVLGIIAMLNLGGSFDLLIRIIGVIILVMGLLAVLKALRLVKN